MDLSSFIKRGFVQRLEYKEFYDRYRVLFGLTFQSLPMQLSEENDDMKALTKTLIKHLAVLACIPGVWEEEELTPVFGTNLLCLKSNFVDAVEKARMATLLHAAHVSYMLPCVSVRVKVLTFVHFVFLCPTLSLRR